MTARFANVSEVPLALAVFLASDNYDYNDDPFTISATTLLKPLRQIILPTRVPPGDGLVNLADMLNNRMGAAIHDSIERAWKDNYITAMQSLGLPQRVIDRVRVNPTPERMQELAAQGVDVIPVYLEQRLKRKIGKWTVTGKFDFVGEGKVQDFKSTSTFTYKKQVNADKYTQQGSIYRWLDPQLITQDQMEIHYIFTDWKPAFVKTDPSYPPKRFHTQSFELMSLSETEAFIRRKIALIEQYWDADEEDIPECDDSELWRSEPVFKYYKNAENAHIPGKRSTKNFDTKPEAFAYMAEQNNVGVVKEVPGQVTACKYCAAFAVCTQKDKLVAAGDLSLT
jgi:hypothetical protein